MWSILFFISFQIWIRHIRKKAIFDNIKTIPYHLLISTKKSLLHYGKRLFQPDHLYTTYRSVVNFQPDHLYTTYRSVVNFHLYPNNSSQKKSINLQFIFNNFHCHLTAKFSSKLTGFL